MLPPNPQATFDELIRQVAVRTTDIKRDVGEFGSSLDPDLEQKITQGLRHREELLLSVGRMVFEWTVHGGSVNLAPPAPVVVPAPPPPTPKLGTVCYTPPAQAPVTPRPVPVMPPPPVARREPPPVEPAPPRLSMADVPAHLTKVLAMLPPPTPMPTSRSAFDGIVSKLIAASIDNDAWIPLPSDIQRKLVGYTAAYARYLQGSEATLPGPGADNIQRVFSPLTTFSKTYRPGFVVGLMRDHTPTTGTWLDDAKGWWADLSEYAEPAEVSAPALSAGKALALVIEAAEKGDEDATLRALYAAITAGVKPTQHPRLIRLLAGFQGMLAADPAFRALRKAVREVEQEDAAPDDDQAAPWDHVELTQGKHAVIIGGDPRNEVVERLKSSLEFADLDWVAHDPRRVENLAAQVRAGSVDMVILLARFINHATQDILSPACHEAGADFVLVPRGYGTSAIRLSIEKAHGL